MPQFLTRALQQVEPLGPKLFFVVTLPHKSVGRGSDVSYRNLDRATHSNREQGRLGSSHDASEPVPAWGLMLQGGTEEYATTAPWIAIFPGVAIVLAVLGISLFGDALRDTLDPKLRKQ